MADHQDKIQKFNGLNFSYWKMQVEDYLYTKDLYLPLLGLSSRPATMSTAEWEILDRKALAVIRTSVSQECLLCITGKTSTMEAMEVLSKIYGTISINNKVRLMKRLVNLKKSRVQSLVAYVNEYKGILHELNAINCSFEDEVKAVLLLSGLSKDWDRLVDAICCCYGSTGLKFDDIVSILLKGEVFKGKAGPSESSDSTSNVEGNRDRSMSNRNGHSSRSKARTRGKSRTKSKSE